MPKGRLTAAANGSGGVVPHPGYRSTNVYTRFMTVAGSNRAVVANQIYLVPIFIALPVVMTGLQIFVGTVSAGSAEIGIYANGAGVPTTLIRDVGTVSTSGTGVKEVTGVNYSAAAGWYWFAVGFNATPSIISSDNTDWHPGVHPGRCGSWGRIHRDDEFPAGLDIRGGRFAGEHSGAGGKFYRRTVDCVPGAVEATA